MDSRTGLLLLLLLFLLRCVGSAPLASDDLFRMTTNQALTLVEKIFSEIPQVHHSVVTMEDVSLDAPLPDSLQTVVASLGIPSAPVLKQLSEQFSLEECVSRMQSGVRVLEQLLLVLSERVSELKTLQADVRDLLTHLTKMTTATQLEGVKQTHLSSRLIGDYEVQLAAHETLKQLHNFCKDLIRSLRAMPTERPTERPT